MQRRTTNILGTIALLCALISSSPSNAQMPDNNQQAPVSMTLYQVERGKDGNQYIVTKAGYRVQIPGLGIAPNAAQVAAFRDNQNNYWYIDAQNRPVQLTAQQLQWTVDQMTAQAQSQNAALNQQMQSASDDSSSKHHRGGELKNTVTTAAGAFAGAALGTTLNTGNYHGIPYGTPCYRQGSQYYYNGPNGRVNMGHNANNAVYMDQWHNQSSWEDARDNHKERRSNLNQNQKAVRYNAATVRRQNNQASGRGAANRGGRRGH